MYFKRLSLIRFKNFEELNLNLNAGFHFITGKNGVGKTNFLDSFYYLSMTRSFQQPNDKALVKDHEGFFRLEADLEELGQQHQLTVKCKPPQIKEWIWDDKKYERLSDHIGRIPVVLIAPDDIYTLTHSSEARRKYLNQSLIQMDSHYLKNLLDLVKVLKQRNAALKVMKAAGKMDVDWLETYDGQLTVLGTYIFKKRVELLHQLNPLIQYYLNRISVNQQEGEVQYSSDVADAGAYADLMRKSRDRDYFTGRTHHGVHKDRIHFTLGDHPLALHGSQGQIKSFVAALKLAQFKYLKQQSGKVPVVLLDDVFAKLDESRVEAFVELLQEEEIKQCFLSDTHEDRSLKLAGRISQNAFVYALTKGQLETKHERIM